MNEQTIREKIKTYILTQLIRDPHMELADDEGIVSGGWMDSFSLADLGVYIDDEFGVYIPDPDLTVDKMDTLDLIVARVMRGLG